MHSCMDGVRWYLGRVTFSIWPPNGSTLGPSTSSLVSISSITYMLNLTYINDSSKFTLDWGIVAKLGAGGEQRALKWHSCISEAFDVVEFTGCF